MAIKPYYTLAQKIDGTWQVVFGDYDRECVNDEMADLVDSGAKSKDFKIIKTDGQQYRIDLELIKLNK